MKPQREPAVPSPIPEMVRIIVERFDPEQVILFGSHARGTPSPDSDVDLLVVMPVPGSKRRKQLEVRLALHGFLVPKDIVVTTPEEPHDLELLSALVPMKSRPNLTDEEQGVLTEYATGARCPGWGGYPPG